MNIKPGDAFLLDFPKEKKHLHIVVEKIISKDILICAFINSITEGKGFDKSCILDKGDCSFIKHPSYVVYDKMQFFTIQSLEGMLKDGKIKIREHVDDAVLEKIRRGALNSKMTPNIFRKYITTENS